MNRSQQSNGFKKRISDMAFLTSSTVLFVTDVHIGMVFVGDKCIFDFFSYQACYGRKIILLSRKEI